MVEEVEEVEEERGREAVRTRREIERMREEIRRKEENEWVLGLGCIVMGGYVLVVWVYLAMGWGVASE